MVQVRCWQLQVSVDGSTWSTVAHYFSRAEAENDAQASLFTYRRINKNAKTRVQVHVESLTEVEFDDLVRQGYRPERLR